MLWIAFKKLYLWYSEQQSKRSDRYPASCELLSKNCIFDILNNHQVFLWFSWLLWIAFKKLYLWYSEQRIFILNHHGESCELLSKNCIFDILNNAPDFFNTSKYVVNCFQKIVSLIFWTTYPVHILLPNLLWIAFKKLYLWYSEQQDNKGFEMEGKIVGVETHWSKKNESYHIYSLYKEGRKRLMHVGERNIIYRYDF